MTRPLLSLVMIVKNEAANIRAVLEAAKPWVDRWTILDTGSTDGTQKIVEEVMADVPGRLFEEPFVDFSTSRNRVLEMDTHITPLAARDPERLEPCAFQLMLSGDEYVRGGQALRDYLETQRNTDVDIHFIKVTLDSTRLYRPIIFRTGSDWRYQGKVHEIPVHPKGEDVLRGMVPPDASIEHIVSDHDRRFEAIWEKHIPLLESELDENPDDERALIFLAQSYESALPYVHPGERITMAMKAMSLQMRRLAIPTGEPVERNYVEMHFLDNARIAGIYTDKELFDRVQALVARDPNRPEAWLLLTTAAQKVVPLGKFYELAARAAEVAKAAENVPNVSAVDTDCEWRAHLLAAVAAKQLSAALTRKDMPEQAAAWTERMKAHVTAGLQANGPWDRFKVFDEQPQDSAQ